ncbi:hypothetical protein SPONN_2205 [uncultured Candidatus Thioglobus sp.]|nr:hypothetical protein SPONN_2205 [uncultured Candidatus Thioglobus sp.]
MKKLILILSLFAITFNVFAASKIITETTKCFSDIKQVFEYKVTFNKENNERIIKDKPSILFEFMNLDGGTKIIFTETQRKTKFGSDIKKLKDALTALIQLNGKEEGCSTSYAIYKPSYKRSNLKVDTIDFKNNIIKTKTFILGPEEHFYLSADLVLTDIKQLKRNANGTLEEKDKPVSFYLGFNYKVGDVLSDNDGLDKISLKFMLKASDRPAESLGLGIGYDTKIGNFFVANLWTKDDNNVGSNLGTTQSVAFGISFDIGKGISWLKQ